MFPVRYWILILTILGNSTLTCIMEGLKFCIPMMVDTHCNLYKPWCDFTKEEKLSNSPIRLNVSCSLVDFGPRYKWTDANIDLFYYSQLGGNLFASIPGGILAENVGAYSMLLYSTMVCAVLNLLRVFFVPMDWRLLVATEFFIGVHLGIAFVSLLVWITSRWAPPNERGLFVLCQAGNPLVRCSLKMLINLSAPLIGWKGIFYNLSVVLLVFWIALWMFGCDNPIKHKKITSLELAYIRNALKGEITPTKFLPPFIRILTSKAFWMVNCLHFGFIGGTRFLTNSMEVFSYQFIGIPVIKFTHIQAISSTGYLLMSVLIALLTDFIRRRKLVCNVATVRILAVVSHLIPGSLLLFIGVAQCNKAMVLALYYMANTTISTGLITCYKTIIDLAPNFAGTIYGMVHLSSSTASTVLLELNLLGNIVQPTINLAGWTLHFLIGGGCLILPAVVFICLGVAKQQKWNVKPADRILHQRKDVKPILRKESSLVDSKKILKKKSGRTNISTKCRRLNRKATQKQKNRLNPAKAKMKPTLKRIIKSPNKK